VSSLFSLSNLLSRNSQLDLEVNMLALVSMTSPSFLPRFRILYNSFRRFHPEWPVTVYTRDGVTDAQLPVDVRNIPLPGGMGDLMSKWRPKMLHDNLLVFDKVCFCGADAEFYGPLKDADELLDNHDVAMAAVPCIQKALPYHDGFPRTQTYCQTGNLNTDFIIAKRSEETFAGLTWWQEACNAFCHSDMANGFFNEHAWFGLMPMMMDKFKIWRTRCYNVCYWNVRHYNIRRGVDGQWYTEGGPLVHAHFSGFDPGDPARTSGYWYHADRVTGDTLEFYRQYTEKLKAATV
jgi:O-antigen biosynthesis protein